MKKIKRNFRDLPETISVGPLTFHPYGVIFATAAMAGFLVAEKRAKIYKISRTHVENLFLITILLGIFFSRVYHVFDYFSYYQENPFEALAIWKGGLGIFGGIFGGVLGVWLYAKTKKLNFLKICDLSVPSLALGQAIGRWGNFFNQEAFGPPTDLPWKIYIAPQNRPEFWANQSFFHPVFLYESLWNFLNFVILLFLEKQSRQRRRVGDLTFFYFAFYGFGRFFIEFLRFDTATINGIKAAHIVSLLFVLGGLFFLLKNHLELS